MDKSGNIIDFLNAKKDLQKRIIKSVSNPYIKLEEDALRIMRAIRFATILNFRIDEELKKAGHAIGMLGGKVESVEEFQIPGTDIERTFVKIKKRKATPKRFPRKAGMPSKDPL